MWYLWLSNNLFSEEGKRMSIKNQYDSSNRPRIFLTKSDLNEDHKATNLEYKQEIAQLLQGFLFFCKCINFSHFFTMFINVLQSQVVI